ncbi:cyclic nucleotide-binding domain-containing protein [Sphingomonas arenae]|uniref:cyclic nucleotide-binding domain-containing protein n=1 Tax=Sphingomonas arenae TaxID=2812555 RepID=UPI0019676EF7|nr:cyclic nucleotide-binding domain-containing protein [Sphingomonas arenae]
MTGQTVFFQALFVVLLIALLVRSERTNHALIGGAGLLGLLYGYGEHGAFALLAPFLVAVVALVQAFSRLLAERSARFTPDEESMLSGPLKGIPRTQARLFFDQGEWIEGEPGDTLIREGERDRRLFYLASGGAEVTIQEELVGVCVPGQLIGEGAILSDDPGTATVRLTQPSRIWSASARALNSYLEAHDEVRHALEHSLTLSLREKLKAANRDEVAD